jgi:hypothetical protein
MAENQTLADLLRQKAESVINFPTDVVRNLTDPQAFLKSFGYTPNQQLSGYSAGYSGVPQKPPSDIGVLDPNNIEYNKGYGGGELANTLTSIAAPLASVAKPFVKPVAKAIGEQAWNATENMMQKQGLMPSIVPRQTVNELGMATTLPKDDIFNQAVTNTPSARLSDEGLHINVMRKQKPEQAMTESVRSGVFYLPEGSPNMKHYGGSTSYGGTDKITGETLYKNPLFVKGATGGKAPEAAYAQLTDKNQLKLLQDDVSKAINGPQDIKYDLVEQFLNKHAPDLSDYASYIYDNSRKGNQLRYALQEAAVAQKVRDTGYDAVIGHSKGKKGPFISEIFDVRESHYPNSYGDFQLNPKFEDMYQNSPPSRRDIIEEQIKKIE